ncbi:molybdenum cofactor guanylyltransferase MobA [Rhizobium sp. SSA_523]|uniref:molybdenum cofactor guanylyltransferase MobA n=1 Tax=Rhizobium sp. SSA_523 TaxID=2952477 RepID=UPI002090F4A7|nr:molybdenum cofactor guanylyltransferase MobA [Rhizobium sp. SSA_523]MCO5730027.1 molybdenum cofactor guanylyltransferase [Rhizobium sp. SSA_523]WKC25097.1 molybdenum cofactor guanylyltransferase MobA [Rhizobium sp. SSA_523]
MTTPKPRHPPAVILAGGQSRRMGQNKAGVMLSGRPLIDHVIARLVAQVSALAINAAEPVAVPPGMPVIADTVPGQRGPLAGILTAMRYAAETDPDASHVLTAPIDSPFLPLDLVDRLAAAAHADGASAIAASAGALHPVCGLWRVDLADRLQAFLEGPEEPRVKAFLKTQMMRSVDFPQLDTPAGPLDPFLNLNTPADLERAETFLRVLP